MTIPPAIQELVDRVLHWPPVVRLQQILATFGEAGGGLLAAGLAYSALFAALTGLLFTVGLVGFVVHDPVLREDVVRAITREVPPLEGIVRDGLLSVASNAGAISIVGLAGLGWSASQFYGALDAAFARVFQKAPPRGQLERIIRGLVSELVVVLGLFAAIMTSSIQAFLAQDLPPGPAGDAARLVSAIGFPALTVVVVVVAVALIYRLVPNTLVPWRSLAPPAIVAGVVLAALTELFVFIAPRLVGALNVFGGIAAVFATLTWLSWAFQVLLIGAAWARERLPEPPPVAGPTNEELDAPAVEVPASGL